jgi:hypothetical protein
MFKSQKILLLVSLLAIASIYFIHKPKDPLRQKDISGVVFHKSENKGEAFEDIQPDYEPRKIYRGRR